eukprot:gene25699-11360_t
MTLNADLTPRTPHTPQVEPFRPVPEPFPVSPCARHLLRSTSSGPLLLALHQRLGIAKSSSNAFSPNVNCQVMFFYTAFWAVALLLIAANAGTDAAAQAGVSKRQVIGDEYKGLLQSMDHKVSTARRLLRGFGATQGERTKRILDSIEEATGPAGLLMEFNNAHDSQIDSIMRVLLEAELIGTSPSYASLTSKPSSYVPPPTTGGTSLLIL